MSLPFFQTEGEVSELPLPKWTEEQRVFQKEVLEFAKESASRDAATCRTREFPYDIYRGIGKKGCSGRRLPGKPGNSNK